MKSIGIAILSICAGTAVAAADSTTDAAQRCKAISDMTARVACYDKLFEAAPAPTPAAAPVASAPAVPAPVAAAPAAATAVPAAGSAVAFGGESLDKTRKAKTAVEPGSLTARVAELEEIRDYTFLISLDNGQVWMQEEMKSTFDIDVGDTVHIEKGRIGGYNLARVSNGKPRGTWVRVTRRE